MDFLLVLIAADAIAVNDVKSGIGISFGAIEFAAAIPKPSDGRAD